MTRTFRLSKHKSSYTVFGLCLFLTLLVSENANAASSAPHPNAQEQQILDQYPSYSDYIHVFDVNAGNNIHEFLSQNVGKTVYIDTAILRYAPISAEVKTEEDRARIPTDRFTNPVYQKCWIDQGEIQSYSDFGPKGYPLPTNEQDIAHGCSTRIRFELIWGDATPSFQFFPGRNKVELVYADFFEVSKQDLGDGKTLYVLTQKQMPEDVTTVFNTYVRKDDRPRRPVSLN